ncbi:MAG: ArnT family glycosyltransferase [Planctomycetaceae bacterium]
MTQAADNLLPGRANRLWRWLSVPSETFTWSRGNDDSALARHRRRVIFALLLTAVVPRIIMAMRLTAVCDDSYYYMWVAEMWEQGRTQTALQFLNINIYPLILWGLQQTGLEASVAGNVWGVIVSGLTVPPLYGLLRRMFDDRVAVVSVMLFAVHPSLMEISVEPIREPTFWFLFVLSMYCLHRLTGERAKWWPVCAGLAVALAVHTRTEGWLLLLPMLLWPLCISPASVSIRRRLLRIATAGCMIPAFLVVVNLTLLHGHDRWEWGRFTALRNLVEWLRSDVSPERIQLERRRQSQRAATRPEVRGTSRVPGIRNRPMLAAVVPSFAGSQGRARVAELYLFLNLFGENFEYLNLLLLLPGSLLLGREMWRGDRLALTLIFGGIIGMIWIRLVQVGNMNGRYFLTAYFAALPTEAVGILWLLRTATAGVRRPAWRIAAPALAGVLLAGCFLTGAFTGGHVERDSQRKLGQWLRARYGPFKEVVVDTRSVRVGYHVRGRLPNVSYYNAGDAPPARPPEIIVVGRPADPSVQLRARQLGLRPLPPEQMPSGGDAFQVFVSGPRRGAVAGSDHVTRQ